MRTDVKRFLAIAILCGVIGGILLFGMTNHITNLKNPIETNGNNNRTINGKLLDAYIGGSIGNLLITATIPESPNTLSVFKGIYHDGDNIEILSNTSKEGGNVTSETDALNVARQILGQYGGLPSDAKYNGAITHYANFTSRTTGEVTRREARYTSVSWWRMLDGKRIIGDNDYIYLELGDNGDPIFVKKQWRNYTYAGNVTIIPVTKAIIQLESGEVISPPLLDNQENINIYGITLGYYAKGINSSEITLEPVWIFYGNTSSGSYLSFQVYARQFGNFTATPTTGNAPLNVTFNDTSDASPTKWLWDFGDGTNSTARNTTHTYISAGNYNISLKAWNDLGSDTMEKPYYINVTDTTQAPTVTGITPNTSINTTTVSITNLSGTNFAAGATVKLNRTGYADIAGTSVTIVSPTKITCSLNLIGKIAGQYNVVLTNPNGQIATLTNGFTVTG
jgi:PKD repeat protein